MIFYVAKEEVKSSKFKHATLEECLAWATKQDILQVDTEIYSKDNNFIKTSPHNSKVMSLQIGRTDRQYFINCYDYDIAVFKDIFENEKVIKLLHNAKFDLKYFIHHGMRPKNIYCTQLAEMILTTGKETPKGYLSLQGLCRRYCNAELNKSVRGQINFLGFHESVILYGAEDVKYLESIREQQLEQIRKNDLEACMRLENLFVLVLADMEYRGFKLDSDLWKKIISDCQSDKVGAEQALDEFVSADPKLAKYVDNQLSLFSTASSHAELKANVNWSSSKQVIKLLKDLGVPTQVVDKQTGETKDSCEAKHLVYHKHLSPFVPLYMKYKEIEKLLTTYGDSFLENISESTGRVHSDYWQILDTGRISSNNPNLQNIPVKHDIGVRMRNAFVAPEGKSLIVADYQAQEPRITADRCKDPALIEFYTKINGDIHSYVASKMFSVIEGKEVNITKADPRRAIGKVLNLKLDYGGSAFTVKKDLGVEEGEAQKFIDALMGAFPAKSAYMKKMRRFPLDHGYVLMDDVTKRRCFLENYDTYIEMKNSYEQLDRQGRSKYYKLRGSFERMGLNYPIQGTAGSMTKLAAYLFYKKIEDLNYHNIVFIVNQVHDEIVVECPDKLTDEVASYVKEAMELAGRTFCKIIPQEVHPIISKHWTK